MRATCDSCGKRRIVHRCRCMVCYPGSNIRLCEKCELKELRKQCKESVLAAAVAVASASSSTTNNEFTVGGTER